jgi:hypothetical protein
MRQLRFTFSGATAARKWTVDADTELVGFNSTDASAFITTDPKLTSTEFITPTSNAIDRDLIGSGYGPFTGIGPAVPLSKGRDTFLTITAAGSIFLFLEDTAEPNS